MRIDLFLFQNGYVKSRQKAKSLIEEGNVSLDGKVISKPSFDVDELTEHTVSIVDKCPYVSRGGLKLEGLLKSANIDVTNKVCLDVGASTGGFTHCLILNGAKKVFAVDSGTNQLAPELKNDTRVTSLEGFNARNITVDDLGCLVDIITIDVSFISQTLIMPSAFKLLNDSGTYLSLIKPQFEAGRANISKGGIVKSARARFDAVKAVVDCAKVNSMLCTHLIKSPIQGGDGNIEYLAVFSKTGKPLEEKIIKNIVLQQ